MTSAHAFNDSQAGQLDAAELTRARIVIADDEPLAAAALEEFLHATGYEQVQVLTGADLTLERLREAEPDLVFVELAMVGPSALELLAGMRADRVLRHVPVMALASDDNRRARLQALENGANDVLCKPIDPAELRARLRNTLASKAHNDRLALTDTTTGLPNRESVAQRLDWALRHTRRYDTVGAVLKIGFDRIRQVNDALGPTLGSELLRTVAQRLQTTLRESDVLGRSQTGGGAVLARGDGDEFTVLLPVLELPDHAALVAQRIIDLMAKPFMVGGYEIFVTCRVGIAVFPTDSLDRDTVLRQAAVAMRHSAQGREAGANTLHFYSKELNARSVQRLGLERELRHALDHDQLVLHYQPKVHVASGRISGAEVLLRWQHPQRGLLGPDEFITVAEEAGLIGMIGDWVLRQALHQLAAWRSAGLNLPHVAVNVSSLQFQRRDLANDVCDALIDACMPGTSLCLELTESAILESGDSVTETLLGIKRMGVRLALDDFGTGYSSLSYLHRFPLDELKIDRSFLAACDTGGASSTLTAAIIAMGHRLGLRVVAEGVENEAQLAFVRAEGCDQYQGYLFSRPLPAGEFARLLAPHAGAANWHAPTQLDDALV